MNQGAQANFYFWGSWGGRRIKEPVLAQKISGQFKKVMLGEGYIIGLTDKNKVVSWGKDTKNGCLGLGRDASGENIIKQDQPRELDDPELSNIEDVQIGPTHVVALTRAGGVYCWGNGEKGQLGLGKERTKPSFKPEKVESLQKEKIKQIAVIKNSNFALTQDGRVYAWGENDQNFLALSETKHSLPQVEQPTCLSVFGDGRIQRLEVFENRIIIAHLCSEEESHLSRAGRPLVSEEGTDHERFKEVLAKVQGFYLHLLNLKHGQPYDLPSDAGDTRTTSYAGDFNRPGIDIEEELNVDSDKLRQAERHLAALLNASYELLRRHQHAGSQDNQFLLCMFIDECRLRREKVLRTMKAKELIDAKRKTQTISAYSVTDFADDSNEEVRKIIATTKELQAVLETVRNVHSVDVMSSEFKITLMELLECKLQLNDTRVELLKAAESKPSDPMLPALRIIKERWNSLKHCSLYALYHECEAKDLNYEGDDNTQLAYLVKLSNQRINEIRRIEDDQIVSHDTLVPQLCYDLLRENAELRKMSNSYQLHVMMLHQGKKIDGAHLGMTTGGAPLALEQPGGE